MAGLQRVSHGVPIELIKKVIITTNNGLTESCFSDRQDRGSVNPWLGNPITN
jgi:hypothetical protein